LTETIGIVLPAREQVASGRAGAVALNVLEFGRVSAFRGRMIVVGGTERGDFALPYHQIKPTRASWSFWHRASERYAEAVADTIARHRCVLVEVHNRGRLFRRLADRLMPHARMSLYLHNDPQTMDGLRTPRERAELLGRASMIYCLSDYIRSRFVHSVPGPLERIVVLPNGVMPLPAHQHRQQSILFVGRLIPEKGVEELFAALRQIAPELPDWQAIIIGRAPPRHRSRYERMLGELKAIWGDRIVVKELLPHAEVMQAYAKAAITIVPSRWQEPFGRTALEALAAGCAVVASRSGGLPEILGQAGFLLDAVTPDAITAAVLALARDPARRAALGKAGEERVAAQFDIGLLSQRLDTWRNCLLG
jgi:glycosyltransferase involved in cell wall biosynthesis